MTLSILSHSVVKVPFEWSSGCLSGIGGQSTSSVPVIAIQRTALPPTPLFFPSPDGHYLALLAPVA